MQRIVYYPYSATIDESRYILIWYTDSAKGDVFLKANGKPVVGLNKSGIEKQLRNKKLRIEWSQAADVDIDALPAVIKKISRTHSSNKKQNNLLLNAWNFFEDLTRTFGIEKMFLSFRNPLLNKVYDKIFWGSNLEAVTPANKSYTPIWDDEEIKALQLFLTRAKEVFIPKITGKHSQALRPRGRVRPALAVGPAARPGERPSTPARAGARGRTLKAKKRKN